MLEGAGEFWEMLEGVGSVVCIGCSGKEDVPTSAVRCWKFSRQFGVRV